MASAAATTPAGSSGPSVAGPGVSSWLGLGTVALLAVGLALAAATHQFAAGGLLQALILLPWAAVGVVVARRQPRNALGWLMLAVAFSSALTADAGYYSLLAYCYGHADLPLAPLAVALAPLSFLVVLLSLPIAILLFPEGRLPTPRWRWPLLGYLAVWSVVLLSDVVREITTLAAAGVPRIDSSGALVALNHKTGWFGAIFGIASPLYGVFGLSFVIAQVLAFRRSHGARRQQLKWLLVGGAAGVAGLTFGIVVVSASSSGIVALFGLVGYLCVAAVPVSIGVGILRYRLYDVDRLISRTLSYTLLTGTLVAVFFGIVVLATRVLPFSSPVGVAASTLAAAALFNPLRRRLQRLVDHRFNRSRYDTEAIVAGFSARLRGAADLESVHAELLRAVEGAIEPAHASVWIRPG